MSPRAASRLEGLGFSKVYDYPPGKAGWSASGFPTEGTQANAATIGGAAGRADLRPGGEGRDRQGARARSRLGQVSGRG
jgi:hypothetical protein